MAVTTNQVLSARNPRDRVSVPLAAGVLAPEATLLFEVAASGFGTDSVANGANPLAGVVIAGVDNTGGVNGERAAEVYTDGEFDLPGTGFTQALVGDKAYATDNFTVTGTSTNATLVGRFTEFLSATRMRIAIEVGAQA